MYATDGVCVDYEKKKTLTHVMITRQEKECSTKSQEDTWRGEAGTNLKGNRECGHVVDWIEEG